MKNIKYKKCGRDGTCKYLYSFPCSEHSANVSEELKRRVYKAIEETNYRVNPIASTLKSARRIRLHVLPSLKQTYYTDIIKGLSDYCYERQITPIIWKPAGSRKRKNNSGESGKAVGRRDYFIPSKNAVQQDIWNLLILWES